MNHEACSRLNGGRGRRTTAAFTLVELLVVIAIIAALAALTFPAVRAAKIAALRSRAKSEMAQIETGIERYKDKLGYYPPDNPTSYYTLNQLYYELLGTTNANGVYRTLDGSAQIANTPAAFQAAFGPGSAVTGFMNCVRGGGDDVPSGAAFLSGLKPSQFLAITNGSSPVPVCAVLGSRLDGPLEYQNAQGGKINPWRYNSSSPQHNPKSYDLWIDVLAGDKTNRICNWSDKPITVYYDSPAMDYP